MASITINQVFPWGRSLDEYRRMFCLSEADLKLKIVGCAAGPASFNAEMTQQGHRVISCDPLYQFSAEAIRRRIDATHPQMVEFAQRNRDAFVWETIGSPEELGQIRKTAMDRFLADYEAGKREGRYILAALPHLPFAERAFDLALCSHFLFLYSQQFSLEFHLEALVEMARIAREVRVFPLLEHGGGRSCHLDGVVTLLGQRGYKLSVEPVPYEFQRGGNEMLRLR